jgi:hypothetical protein
MARSQGLFVPNAWRGAALACSRRLAIFASALHPTKECCSRRLPGITQRDAFTCGFQFVHNRAIELRKRWVVPGSRLFSHVSARLVMRRRLRGWRDTRQSGSPPGFASKQASSTCQPFRARGRARWEVQSSFSRRRRANLSGLVTTKTSLIRPRLTFTETTENGFPCR